MTVPGLFLFAYGTLQIPEVMQAVTGQKFPSIDAVLNGYCRYSIKNEIYPAIITQPGASVNGQLYAGFDQSALNILDVFEDDIYTRCGSEVMTTDNVSINAQVYVISDEYRYMLSDKPWKLDWFRQNHLDDYLEVCRKFFIEYNRKIQA